MTTMRLLSKPLLLLAGIGVFLFANVAGRAGEPQVKSGEKVVFLGDSITQFGWSNPGGYVRLVVAGFAANGIEIVPSAAGVSGNHSTEMLARLERSVLAKKPEWMTLSCGVNDVMHGAKGVALEDYKTRITSIVDQAQAAGIKIVIMTATPIREVLDNDANQRLSAYNEFLRTLARERNYLLADTNAAAQAAIKTGSGTGRWLTLDGVHMNPRGDELMAATVLTAFGLNEAQLRAAREAWAAIPDAWSVRLAYYGSHKSKSLYLTLPLTRAEYEQVEDALRKKQSTKSVLEFVRPLYEKEVKAMLKPEGAYENLDQIFAEKKERAVVDELRVQLGTRVREFLAE